MTCDPETPSCPILQCDFHHCQDFGGAWWNFVPKVIADQTVWSVFLNAAYSTMIMSLQGMRPPEVQCFFFAHMLLSLSPGCQRPRTPHVIFHLFGSSIASVSSTMSTLNSHDLSTVRALRFTSTTVHTMYSIMVLVNFSGLGMK